MTELADFSHPDAGERAIRALAYSSVSALGEGVADGVGEADLEP